MIVRRLSVVAMLFLAASAFAAEKSEIIEKSYPAPAGKVVLIDAGGLDLVVRSAEIQEIRLKVELTAGALTEAKAKAWIAARRPVIEDGEGQLRVTAPDPGGVSFLKGVAFTRARIELALPLRLRPDLSTSSGNVRVEGEFAEGKPLRLRSSSGDIEFLGWAPEVEVRSTSGDIQLRATRPLENLLARTASGGVTVTGGARTTRCDASSGDVHLEGLVGPIGVATTSGHVTARFDTLGSGDELKITTSSGKVRLTLPPGSKPGGELSSSKGEIRSVYPGDADVAKRRVLLSGHGPKVFVTTSSGRIELL